MNPCGCRALCPSSTVTWLTQGPRALRLREHNLAVTGESNTFTARASGTRSANRDAKHATNFGTHGAARSRRVERRRAWPINSGAGLGAAIPCVRPVSPGGEGGHPSAGPGPCAAAAAVKGWERCSTRRARRSTSRGQSRVRPGSLALRSPSRGLSGLALTRRHALVALVQMSAAVSSPLGRQCHYRDLGPARQDALVMAHFHTLRRTSA